MYLLSSDFRAIASSFCWLDYSTLLFNSPYCRKFLFKLPSTIVPWTTSEVRSKQGDVILVDNIFLSYFVWMWIRIQAMVWGKCQDAGKCHSSNDLNKSSMPVSHNESLCSIHWNRHLTYCNNIGFGKLCEFQQLAKGHHFSDSSTAAFLWLYSHTRFWWRFAVLCSACSGTATVAGFHDVSAAAKVRRTLCSGRMMQPVL